MTKKLIRELPPTMPLTISELPNGRPSVKLGELELADVLAEDGVSVRYAANVFQDGLSAEVTLKFGLGSVSVIIDETTPVQVAEEATTDELSFHDIGIVNADDDTPGPTPRKLLQHDQDNCEYCRAGKQLLDRTLPAANVRLAGVTATSASLVWDDPTSRSQQYRVRLNGVALTETFSRTLSWHLRDLDPTMRYTVQIETRPTNTQHPTPILSNALTFFTQNMPELIPDMTKVSWKLPDQMDPDELDVSLADMDELNDDDEQPSGEVLPDVEQIRRAFLQLGSQIELMKQNVREALKNVQLPTVGAVTHTEHTENDSDTSEGDNA